ncbi:Uncharacterised protein [Mycobacteroides abscessus subsp. abscessus]|uniref:hypothetical protein n=1 Tax=Mycobacteroides abscessus TaxID=36809 RepID=UPI000925CB03|nr:hypothetical protein [Mycobacteroides abscessus]MBE5408018.1 hypothetical protein [Mycobacteroides abscessus]MBE5428663.1 hypothetical protein [Mycobacteroides abscessus]MBE5497696.1 hypothetical protein [Mycobacteroides abscessus]MBE5514429.1 hypothetical protein [Mycobacteroides abscessus]MBN7327946.1 hypothetical protein [Mycobacteroides abscessus subsp. abscessus]
MNDCPAVQLALGGVSRSTVRRLWRSKELASVTIGRRRFSTDDQLAEYIAKLEAV